eukprot:CAMPEP_0204902704 /NCGR_PEP_ID=MMETSP1397-20131031/3824_1 /ASSEMBLY_ACC=CAM_ASM_000891 /TAXON_ID=49980 /ORGANISM="Climacostomum Climacostomum virens, Strain Stock W-24" /LENGTH=257 /DNA_ID=CAMNT_0052071243 /DNA_START=339 /DNA_END=1108 /DNA_ORIENTATION=-
MPLGVYDLRLYTQLTYKESFPINMRGFKVLLVLIASVTSSYKIALVWDCPNLPFEAQELANKLAYFLLSKLDTSIAAKGFCQAFTGDLTDVYEFEPDVVIDYSAWYFRRAANAKALAPKVLYYYTRTGVDYHENAAPLKGDDCLIMLWTEGVARYFGITQAIVIQQINHSHPFEGTFQKIWVNSGLNQDNFDRIALREVRASGVHAVILLTDTQTTEALLRSFAKFEMTADYMIIVLGDDCIFDASIYPTGLLCLAL